MSGVPISCFKCGSRDHITVSCPSEEYLCFSCKQPGHWSAACPRPCFNCKENGHRGSACPKSRGFNATCFQCGEVGHFKSNCPNKKCFKCGTLGHKPSDCPQVPYTPGRCFLCGSLEHMRRDCPQKSQTQKKYSRPSVNQQSQKETKSSTREFKTSKTEPGNTGPTNSFSSGKSGPGEKPSSNRDFAQLSELNRLGNVAFSQKQYVIAIELHSRVIALCPEEAAYLTNRAASYLNLKDFRAAATVYLRAITLSTFRPSVKVYERLSHCHLALGNTTPALLVLREALAIDPRSASAKMLKSQVIALSGHISDFQGARSRDHWRMAQESYDKGRQVIDDQCGATPTEWLAWKIELQIAAGNLDQAHKGANEALLADPHYPDLLILKGIILLLTAKLPESLQETISVLRLDPDNARARILRLRVKTIARHKDDGNALFGDSNWQGAINEYAKALNALGELQSEGGGGLMRATLLFNKATALSKLSQYTEALRDIDRSVTLWPSYFKAWRIRGRINLQIENYDAAVEDFKQALSHAGCQIRDADIQALRQELKNSEEKASLERNKQKNFYTILGLSQCCTNIDIKKAYRRESLKHHPDKGGSEDKFRSVNEAYTNLSDPIERKKHDKELAEGGDNKGSD